MRVRPVVVLAAGAVVAISIAVGLATAQAPATGERGIEMSPISGDPARPRRHFRLRDAMNLEPEEAMRYYEIARLSLVAGYARSGEPAAREYATWRRANSTPYLSATHGRHYLVNYVNEKAAAYLRPQTTGVLPRGAIVAKDSFAVTETGGILLGPLFVMEKMAPGFNRVSGDWRYTLVQPDGTLFGETKGRGAERVDYCIACHLARERHDHLYFVPEPYRVPP